MRTGTTGPRQGQPVELRQLKYFVAIAEQGSFSKAAETVFVAQSALSHQVAKLEQELGARLLHRVARGVTLTERGRVFLAHAIAVLKQASDAKLSVRGSLDAPRGRVTVGLPPSVCNPLSVPLLLEVRRELPGVELELVEEVTGNMVAQMRGGLLNLALMFDSPDLAQFHHEPLVEERLYLISKATGSSRPAAPIGLKAALALPLLLASPAQSVRKLVETAARDNGLPRPNVVAEINSVNILRLACLAGLGHAILPPAAFVQEIDAGRLSARPILRPQLRRTVHVCFPRHVPMTPATRAVHRIVVRVACALCESSAWRESTAVWTPADAPLHGDAAVEP